ncbi:MAG: hypothetical protein OXC07_08890 [Kistimonas sp.]|nr:hypothetical protein [Kistimonas sp.]
MINEPWTNCHTRGWLTAASRNTGQPTSLIQASPILVKQDNRLPPLILDNRRQQQTPGLRLLSSFPCHAKQLALPCALVPHKPDQTDNQPRTAGTCRPLLCPMA